MDDLFGGTLPVDEFDLRPTSASEMSNLLVAEEMRQLEDDFDLNPGLLEDQEAELNELNGLSFC